MSDLAQNPPAVRTVLAGLMLSIFLSALDQTIVAVSLPAISADFADLDLLAWVISAYMVAMTVSMPIYGKLGDLYGRRRLMLFAIVVFTAASLLCGLAQSMGQLVLARVLQGIGAGGLMAVSQAIIGDIVPPRERGRYQGYFSSMYAIASVAGPVLGGLLTEYLSWRWVFWINLPIGLLALAISRRTLVGLPVPRRQPVIDYLGIVLMVVGLTALLLAITQIGQGAAWSDPALLGLFALAALALLLFVAQERRFREPLVPMQLFAVRAATLSWLVAFFASFQAISLTVLVPLRYQSVTGAGADSAAPYRAELEAQGVPTLVVDYSKHSWQELATELGRHTGLERQAQAAIQRFDAYTAEVAAAIAPPQGPVSVVGYNIAGSYSIGRQASPQARLLEALGFQVAELPEALAGKVTRASDFQFISRENLPAAIAGDSVFLLGASDDDVQAFLADPVLANLSAVREKRVYALGPSSFRIDYYSGRQMIDNVARHFR